MKKANKYNILKIICLESIIHGGIRYRNYEQIKNLQKKICDYVSKYKPKYSIRISSKNFGFANNIKSVPLYATFLIK